MRRFCTYADGSWALVVRYDPPEMGVERPVYYCMPRGADKADPTGSAHVTFDPREMLYHLYNHRLDNNHIPQKAIDGLAEDVEAKKMPTMFEHHFGR